MLLQHGPLFPIDEAVSVLVGVVEHMAEGRHILRVIKSCHHFVSEVEVEDVLQIHARCLLHLRVEFCHQDSRKLGKLLGMTLVSVVLRPAHCREEQGSSREAQGGKHWTKRCGCNQRMENRDCTRSCLE